MRIILSIVISASLASTTSAAEVAAFQSAKAVWPAGREKEMNLLVRFRAPINADAGQQATLRIAGSSIYRASLNGEFVGCGPARGPHGYYRIDEWSLNLRPGENVVSVEVAGYNVNSFYLLDQPSFLQAEVVSNGRVLASTGGDGVRFTAQLMPQRVQKVQRYSFQRPFSEVYRLRQDQTMPAAELAEVGQKNLLPRRVLRPQFAIRTPIKWISQGQVAPAQPSRIWKDRSLTDIGPKLKGYKESELAYIPSIEVQKLASKQTAKLDGAYDGTKPSSLSESTYRTADFGTNFTGFIGATLTCTKPSRLWFVFDEILSNGDVDPKRLSCVNIVSYDIEPGTYAVETIEPYTLKYLKLMCLRGDIEIKGIYLREYAHPQTTAAKFVCSDPRLNKLYSAGVETFRQNALDIYMDCPSRERAGWLCDSYFTARVERDLAGASRIERNFLENYLLPDKFEHLPEGVLAMCYPADHYDGVFIPNWAMWFVVELEEYAQRTGDRRMLEAARPKMLKLLAFLKKYENEDGLLEKLPSWVFVEWSAANSFVQDVNYPSNMLYAGVLSAMSRMYDMPEPSAKAEKIRDTIRRQFFDGKFFVDNAVRKDGKLQVTRNRTECCQYFAFYFDVATPKSHPQLWKMLLDEFGPRRQQTKAYSDVPITNQFIGNMLRMELLSREGRSEQIAQEAIGYWLHMAETTGTLWENNGAEASCDHGFASHAVHTLYRDVLGLRRVDSVNRRVDVRLPDMKMEWCEGQVPTQHGPVSLRWWHENGKLQYKVSAPEGYAVTVEKPAEK